MNYVTPGAANFFLAGAFDWAVDTWRNALIDGSWDFDSSVANISDLPSGAIISDIEIENTAVVDGGAVSSAFDHGTLAAEITRTIYRHWIYHSSGMLVAHFDRHRWGEIRHTIDGTTPIIIIPTGPWWRFQVG